MSFNQSRSDKSAQHYRKTGARSDTSGQQRGFTAAGLVKGGGGGGASTGLPTTNATSTGRSFNKSSSNVQGGQPGVGSSSVQNGTHGRSAPQGASDVPVAGASATQKSTRPDQRGPSPNSAAASPDANVTAPTTPAKAGDGSGEVSFQFGSLSPGLMNVMQIPARTSSAPPNLDEQKGDQARYNSYRAAVRVPIPSVPKQQLPRKDVGGVDHSNPGAAKPPDGAKRETQVSSVSPAAQTQKPSVHAMPGMVMQTSFHPPQVSVPFSVPNTQIHPQSMTTPMPIPFPIPLPIGSAPQVQQQLFVPGHPNHMMQPQGIMPQGQVMNFSPPLRPQLTPQLGNMGTGQTSQYPQQQSGNFGSARRPVKITDPRTHEELRLDKKDEAFLEGGLPGVKPQSNPPQSQSIPPFGPAHPINYYSHPYDGLFYRPTFSPSATQINSNSLPPRFSQAQPTLPSMNSALTSMPSNKTGTLVHGASELLNSEPVVVSSASSRTVQVTVKPAPTPVVGKVESPSPPICSSTVQKVESPKPLKLTGEDSLSKPHKDSELCSESSQQHPMVPISGEPLASNAVPPVLSVPSTSAPVEAPLVLTNIEGGKKEPLSRSNSIRDNQKKPAKKGHHQSQHQVGGLEHGRDNESVEAKTSQSLFNGGDMVLESVAPLTIIHSISFDASESKTDTVLERTAITNEVGSLVTVQGEREPVRSKKVDDKVNNNILVSTSTSADSIKSETDASNLVSPTISDVQGICCLDTFLSRSNSLGSNANAATKYSTSGQSLVTVSPHCLLEATSKHEGGGENNSGDQACLPVSGSKDKPAPELTRSKSSIARGRKKKKESIPKADVAGTVSDMDMAFKVSEEKKESSAASESMEFASSSMQVLADVAQEKENQIISERGCQGKAEPDDWEDTAGISMAKKYSRDFLLKFSEQCTALIPDDFGDKPDIEALMSANVNISYLADRESHPSPGRFIDRASGGSRLDRRGSGALDDDKWSKQHVAFPSRDVRLDMGYAGNAVGFKSAQGGNNGVLKKPRPSFQHTGGILYGPQQSLGPHGGMPRNCPDADRWQRATGFQKGLFLSQQSPFQAMHKAESKYEIGKVADEEEAKQRRLKAILNKLTPQNFEKLFEQVKAVNIDNALTLTGIISQIFDKALMEPTFCEMYANFCSRLSVELPDLSEDNEKITFRRLLLNKCQEEFEKGEREQEEADRIEEGEIKLSDQEREQKRFEARRRMLGNIRLIGELYKKRMLTDRIMHECIKKLLGQCQTPDEEDIEALCKLMSTIGEMFDQPKARDHMNGYFERMADLSDNIKLSSRVRFMLRDAIDLRSNKWQQRRKIEGPKKIEEVHRDAAQERAQIGRIGRGPGINPPARRPMDFGSRGSAVVASSNAHIGGYRGLPTQSRGFGAQDVRLDDRHSHDGRALSVPLSQKSINDDSITLGPQGGLAKGMSIRGQPLTSSNTLSDIAPSPGNSWRMTSGPNVRTPISEWTSHNSREDAIPRYMSDKSTYDQLNTEEQNTPFGIRDTRNLDCSLGNSLASSTPSQVQGPILSHSVASEKVWPEERLHDRSIAAIKEFYSAKDEKEVGLCIKDLNSPGFYPTMISIWVTDSFERKDGERDLLAKLLVTLAKSRDGMLSQPQLIKGFEAVLTTLDDAVNDAPKAAEFLGRMFAKIILENVVPLSEIGQLIYDGGEEPGTLRESGLAAEVLGSTLETIKSEKGDSVLNEICSSSSLRLENFKHPDPFKSRKLQMFIQ